MGQLNLYQFLMSTWTASSIESEPLGDGIPAPSAPAVEMPTLLAVKMLSDLLDQVLSEDPPKAGKILLPVVTDQAVQAILSRVRQKQLAIPAKDTFEEGFPAEINEKVWWCLVPDEPGTFPPHSVFLLPRQLGIDDTPQYAIWACILYFIVAVEGGERMLDVLAAQRQFSIPFQESWEFRSRVNLPTQMHELMYNMVRWPIYGTTYEKMVEYARKLRAHCRDILEGGIHPLDLRGEIIQVDLDPARSPKGMDFPCRVSGMGTASRLEGNDSRGMNDTETVRIAQTRPDYNFPMLASNRLLPSRSETQEAVKAVVDAVADLRIASGDGGGVEHPVQIVIFPEVALPISEIGTIASIAGEIRTTILIGCLWRRLPAVRGGAATHSFVNEALLAAPYLPPKTGIRKGALVRKFFVRKPLPTHVEQALARRLQDLSGGTENWRIIPGHRWYRFLHPRLIDFTVAICEDLLDPAPWQALQGKILHLFQPAYNIDTDLFDALTWIRAYENFINVVSVNHGHPGGSISWTPKRSHGKGIVALKGQDLTLKADIQLPVRSLDEQQRNGKDRAVLDLLKEWVPKGGVAASTYKAPTPNFKGRR